MSASGSLSWVLTTRVPLFDETGRVTGLVGIGRDITRRKEREDKNQQLATLVESSDDAIVSFDLDRRVTAWNGAAERLYGYTAEEMIGAPTSLTIPPELEAEARLVRERVMQGEQVTRYETTRLRKDASRVSVSLTLFATRNVEGAIVGLASVARDITEQKRAEEVLRESERRLTDIFDFLPDATFAIDTGGTVTAWNRAIEKMTGWTKEQMLGCRDNDYAIPFYGERRPILIDLAFYDQEEIAQKYAFVERNGDTCTAEIFAPVLHDGEGAYLWGVATLLRNEKSVVVGAIESIRDITDRKKAEEEKARLEAWLLQAQKMESVGRLAGGVAHDFNNMLGVILGHTEMALEEVDSTEPLHADLEEIRKAASRSADLTRQLLAFARKQAVAPRVLDLNETIGEMLTMLKRLVGENVHLVWQPKADLWPVMVDRSQIDQLLTNLCVNARDAIVDVGQITIETGNSIIDDAFCADHAGFVPGEYALLAVADDGHGMDKETQSHLFEPFFTTKGIGKGTGLGLATVYGIVKQNYGFINVSSTPGNGSRFTIYMPRYLGNTEQTRGQRAEPSAMAPRGRETILLVEDEPASLRLISKMLEKQGYTVLAAGTPGEAIRMAREHAGEIHLLATDVIMPEMNGRDLARNLLSLFPRLKILFASGYTADVITHQGVLDEGVHFIQKPFSRKKLAEKVREVLESE